MRKAISWGAMLIFLAVSYGTAVAWEPKSDGTPKTTKDKWVEQKKDKIDQDAAQQKKKVVAPGMKAVDQAGADRRIKEIDDKAAQKKAQVEADAKDQRLGGDHIYQKDKPKSNPSKSNSSTTSSAKSKEPK